MPDWVVKQAGKEYPLRTRLLLMPILAAIFLVVLPLALVYLGRLLDRSFGWPELTSPPLTTVLGGLMVLGGWLLGVWTVYLQVDLGRGTPVPVMATQKLIVRPPYAYCRNPMALGAIVAYLGVGVLAGSVGAALLVILGATVLLSYIRVTEEKELAARFGEDYLAYRRQVPFLIPQPRRRGGASPGPKG